MGGSRGAAVLGVDKYQENQKISRDERNAAEKYCQPLACQLQACASRNVYAQERCNGLKHQYKTCLTDYHNNNNTTANPSSTTSKTSES
mmetsp:Transcript_42805/g.48638  ORF Transcript_42805/g.48638 Transcript_42805/m.48638 type:complete len:89 (-) Transcript_42805:182-448(-)